MNALHLRVKRRGYLHAGRLRQSMIPVIEVSEFSPLLPHDLADPILTRRDVLSPMALADRAAERDRAQVYRMDVPHNLPLNEPVNEAVNEPPPGYLRCVCGKTMKLRHDGRLRSHEVKERGSAECRGSDRTPSGLLVLSITASMNSPQGITDQPLDEGGGNEHLRSDDVRARRG